MFAALLSACTPTDTAGDTATLTLLDDHGVEAPVDDDDATPERAVVLSGSEDEYDWAVVRGWVKVDGAAIRDTLTNPDVAVNRRKVTEWTVAALDDAEMDASYVVTEVVTDPITVDYDLTWRHLFDGEGGSVAVWEKTAGTTFVSLVRGGLSAVVVGDAIDFTAVFHLATVDSDTTDTELFVQDFYASVLADAHGEPLPDWTE
jgi:hypothetical protein